MSVKPQNNLLVLAFDQEYRGEGICERENCKQAWKQVKANKGSPGVDRMTVQQLPEYLKQHWPTIREQLQSGTYKSNR